MKVELFKIRLTENELEIDQNSLNDFLEMISFKKSDTQFIESEEECYWSVLVHYEEPITKRQEQIKEIIELSQYQQTTYENLRQWRKDKATREGIKSFMICHNSELMEVVVKCPNSKEELKQIKGFGEVKSDKYGEDIVAILKRA